MIVEDIQKRARLYGFYVLGFVVVDGLSETHGCWAFGDNPNNRKQTIVFRPSYILHIIPVITWQAQERRWALAS